MSGPMAVYRPTNPNTIRAHYRADRAGPKMLGANLPTEIGWGSSVTAGATTAKTGFVEQALGWSTLQL
jgi:hypothetical protein